MRREWGGERGGQRTKDVKGREKEEKNEKRCRGGRGGVGRRMQESRKRQGGGRRRGERGFKGSKTDTWVSAVTVGVGVVRRASQWVCV